MRKSKIEYRGLYYVKPLVLIELLGYKHHSPKHLRLAIIFLLGFFFLSAGIGVDAQNLVPNPSFEEYDFKLLDHNYYKLNSAKGWKHLRFSDAEYIHAEKHLDYPIKAKSGSAMIRLNYSESCPYDEPSGCASYATVKLLKPLEIGEIYNISFSIYFPDNEVVESEILNHIGFKLNVYEQIQGNPHKMISEKYFFNGEIKMDQWNQISVNIRALCDLQYLTIGTFVTSKFPTKQRTIYNDVSYYIDDVVVEQKHPVISDVLKVTPYCKYYEQEEVQMFLSGDSFRLYFDYDKDSKISFDIEKLKDWLEIDNYKGPLIIQGYTSDEGSDAYNKKLAARRAIYVQSIMEENKIYPKVFLQTMGIGVDTVGSNQLGEKRRVEIIKSRKNIQSYFYDLMIMNIEKGNEEEMELNFKRWTHSTENINLIIALFDPRLMPLKQTEAWGKYKLKLQKNYKSRKSFLLDSFYFVDQKYRTLEYDLRSMSNRQNKILKEYFSLPLDSLDIFSVRTLNNLMSLGLLNDKFPVISGIGRRQSKALLYILKHSQDKRVIEKWLPTIEKYCRKGEAEWEYYAYLYDSNKILLGLPQEFGTQMKLYDTEDDNKKMLRLYKVDNKKKVNERRIKIGLNIITDFERVVILNTSLD